MNKTKFLTPDAPPRELPYHTRRLIDLIIFDIDGVILSETGYWDTARLTLWEILERPNYLGRRGYFGSETASTITKFKLRENIAPDSILNELKRLAINSNWDKTFVLTSLHLVGILSLYLHRQGGDPVLPFLEDSLATTEQKLHNLNELLKGCDYNSTTGTEMINRFLEDAHPLTGARILGYVRSFAGEQLGGDLKFFEPKGELWQFCHRVFQEIYHAESFSPFSFRVEEETVLERQRVADALRALNESGKYKLGIATGRPLEEVIGPLNTLGLLSYFDESRIVTYNHVVDAEKIISKAGKSIRLEKPHPFVVLKAIYPDKDVHTLLLPQYSSTDHSSVIVVGDGASDIIAAKEANCVAIGVLTGIEDTPAVKQNKFREFSDLGCDLILDSMIELPYILGLETS